MTSNVTFAPFECPPIHYTTNPANHSILSCNRGYQNYSHYECREQPASSLEFWVMGQRHPTCKVGGRPYLDYWGNAGNRVDDLRPTFPGYDRNARYVNVPQSLW